MHLRPTSKLGYLSLDSYVNKISLIYVQPLREIKTVFNKYPIYT